MGFDELEGRREEESRERVTARTRSEGGRGGAPAGGGGPIPGALVAARRRAQRRAERLAAAPAPRAGGGGKGAFTPRTSWKIAGYSGAHAPASGWRTPASPVSFRGWGGGNRGRGLAASVDVAALRTRGYADDGGSGGAAEGGIDPGRGAGGCRDHACVRRRPSWDAAVQGVHTDLDSLLGRFSAELSGWQVDFRQLQRWAAQKGFRAEDGRLGCAAPSSVSEIIRAAEGALERNRRGRIDAENKALHYMEENERLLADLSRKSAGERAGGAGTSAEAGDTALARGDLDSQLLKYRAELVEAQRLGREAEAALFDVQEKLQAEKLARGREEERLHQALHQQRGHGAAGDAEKAELLRRVSALTAQLQKARVHQEDEQDRLAKQMDSYREEVEQERHNFVQQCEALEEQVRALTAELGERNKSVEALQATVRKSQESMQDLARDIEGRSEKEVDRLKSELKAQESRSQEASAEARQLLEDVQAKDAALGQGRALLKRLEEEIKGLELTTQRQRNELSQLRVTLEVQLQEKDRQIEEFRVGQETQQADFVEDQLRLATEMTEELAKSQTELQQAQNAYRMQEQLTQDLKRALTDNERKVKDLAARTTTLQEELARSRANSENVEASAETALVRALREELRQKEEAFQSLKETRDESIAELKGSIQKQEALKAQSQLEHIGDVPHDTILALKDLAENLVAGFQTQGDRCDEEILRLQTEMSLMSPKGDRCPEEVLSFSNEQLGYIEFLHAFLSSELKGKTELPPLASQDSVTFLAQLVEGVHLSAFLQFYDSRFVTEVPVAVRRQCGLPIHMVCSWIAMTARISHLNIGLENQKDIPSTVSDAINSVLTTTLEILVHTVLHHTVEMGGSLFGEKMEGESVQECILSWLNFLLSESGSVDNLTGLGEDLSNCHAYVALLQQLFNDITGDQWAQGVLAMEDSKGRASAVLKAVSSLAKSYCVNNPASYIQPHHLIEGSKVHAIALVWSIFRILMNHNVEHVEMDQAFSPDSPVAACGDGVDLSVIEFTPKKSVSKCLDFMATPAQLKAAASLSGVRIPAVQEVLEEAQRVREDYGQSPEVAAVLATLKPVGDISTGVWQLAGRQVKLSMQEGLVVRVGGGFEAFGAFFSRAFPNYQRLHFL